MASQVVSAAANEGADVGVDGVATVLALGFSLRKRAYLSGFLPGIRCRWIDDPARVRAGDTVVAWASSSLASALEGSGARVWRVEDGFLRSVGLGASLVRPLSWVVDRTGIYYDASRPSDLELLLAQGRFDDDLIGRARRLREAIVAADLSKYNVGSRRWAGLSPRRPRSRPAVLVIGQVETDASMRTSATLAPTNAALLARVRARHPDAWLVYKPHPDVVAGLRGAGVAADAAAGGCDELVTDAPIGRLIGEVDAIHVNTSLAGFEGLLRGKPVHCHGAPFYAGWGLTHDAAPIDRRGRLRTLDELVAAALICYPRYVDRGGRPCSAEQALEDLIAWRRADDGRLRWWQSLLRPMLHHD